MPFDGAFLSHIVRELTPAVGTRIEKIYQPSRDDVVLTLSGKGFSPRRLLLSVSGVGPRVHWTELPFENPATPPTFCMLMRKHFLSARLEGVRQQGLDRTLFLDFSSYNELGDPVALTIAAELFGRQANLVLIADGRIIDALRRSAAEDAGRLILPGARYEAPAQQDKRDPRVESAEALAAAVARHMAAGEPDRARALAAVIEGVSPPAARRLDAAAARLGLQDALARWQASLSEGEPTLLLGDAGEPTDFTYFAREGENVQPAGSFSALCDAFFAGRQEAESIRRRTRDLSRLVATRIERTARKIEKQRGELAACEDREHLRIFGELLKANLYLVERGAPFVDVVNYYDPAGATVRIPLKADLSPSQNAQRYFTEYRKANTAQQQLTALIAEGMAELTYLESVSDELTRADSDAALAEIREELVQTGLIRPERARRKPQKPREPLRFTTDDGLTVLVGRNNRQNDELTLHVAAKSDLWFHTKAVHGSHVILLTGGKPAPDASLVQAAILAAWHSKARQSSGVDVDYCPVKQVKKPAGVRPGMVIYENYRTLTVTPDGDTVSRLAAGTK